MTALVQYSKKLEPLPERYRDVDRSGFGAQLDCARQLYRVVAAQRPPLDQLTHGLHERAADLDDAGQRTLVDHRIIQDAIVLGPLRSAHHHIEGDASLGHRVLEHMKVLM